MIKGNRLVCLMQWLNSLAFVYCACSRDFSADHQSTTNEIGRFDLKTFSKWQRTSMLGAWKQNWSRKSPWLAWKFASSAHINKCQNSLVICDGDWLSSRVQSPTTECPVISGKVLTCESTYFQGTLNKTNKTALSLLKTNLFPDFFPLFFFSV